jgi:beta-glucanase (GH16 family)
MKKTLSIFLLLFALFALIACDSVTTTTATTSATTTTSTQTTSTTTTTTTSPTTTTTLDPNSLLANIPTECEGVEVVAGWVPTWCEEFNYEGAVNPAKWRHQVAGGGFGNQELQYYTSRSQNAIVDGNKLIITAIKENYQSHAYTSAKIWTQGVKNWKYGKFEMRAKMPSTGGTWPAFWMMPKSINYAGYSTSPINNGWPNSGEIDIMEYVGNNPTTLLGTIHTGKYNHTTGTQIGFSRVVAAMSTTFNTYSITWNETSISWYVNDLKYGTTTFNAGANTDVETYMAWPFDQEFYMILNLAIGGGLGGTVDPAFVSDTFEIDYVRVFQKDYVTGDTANPLPISNLEAVRKTATSAYLIWTRAIDNMQVKWYNVYIDGVLEHKVSLNTIKLSGLPQNTDILVEIEAEDYAGNRSAKTPITFRTAS